MTKVSLYLILLFMALCTSGCESDSEKPKAVSLVLKDCQGKTEVVYHIGTFSEFLEVSCTEYKND